MMRRMAAFAIVALALAATGCLQPIDIHYDYDTRANFSVCRTFPWMNPPAAPPGRPEGAIPPTSFQRCRIRDIAAEILTAKGLKENPDDPDIVIAFHTGVRNRTSFESWGCGFGPFWGSFGPRLLDACAYREGTLVLDFIDAKSKELIWRGVAVGFLNEGGTPEERTARLRNVLTRMFSHYPPR